jgi:hypothetical protein
MLWFVDNKSKITGADVAHIAIINEEQASGQVAEDYEFISASYTQGFGAHMPTPQVYRSSSLVPAYFRFGAVQNRVLTNDGAHDRPMGALPGILINFAVSLHASCFY